MNHIIRRINRTFAAIAIVTSVFVATPSIVAAEDTLTKEQVEKIVREYLLENPEIMFEMREAYERKQQEELAVTQRQILENEADAVYNADYQIEFGDPNAKHTIVEFFDYNCGFCQRALSDMQQILQDNPDVRFVLKEYPVLGEASVQASRVSMAVSKLMPEKHPQYHVDLLSLQGVKDGDAARDLAIQMGADEAALNAELEKAEIDATISEVYRLAQGLGINGTPSYVVGDSVVFGAVGQAQLIAELRKSTQ